MHLCLGYYSSRGFLEIDGEGLVLMISTNERSKTLLKKRLGFDLYT